MMDSEEMASSMNADNDEDSSSDSHDECEEDNSIFLLIKGTKIKCDKQLLIDGSDYFRGMFSSHMKESEMDVIELKEVHPHLIEVLVDSLTYDPVINEDNVYELLEASVIYQFKDMQKLCCDFLEETLSSSNCLTVQFVADMFSLFDLYQHAKVHSLWYFEDVAKETEIKESTEDQLVEYLSDKSLNCSDEWIVFKVICDWLAYQFTKDTTLKNQGVDNLAKTSIELMNNERESDVGANDISTFEQKDDNSTQKEKPSATTNDTCKSNGMENGNIVPNDNEKEAVFHRVFEKCLYLDMMCRQQLELLLEHPLVAECRDVKKYVKAKLGCRKSSIRLVDPDTYFIERRCPRSILCFGGHLCSTLPCPVPEECDVGNKGSDLLWFDPQTGSFKEEPQTEESRSEWGKNALRMIGCQVTLVDNEVYVTGGEAVLGRNTWQYAVTVFNCLTRTWSCKKDLRKPRRHHAACSVNDKKLFLLGGFGQFRKIINSVESYDVQSDRWNDHAPMLQPEFAPAVAVCNNSIYIFKTQIQRLNLSTETWSFITIDQPLSSNVNFALTYNNMIYLCCKFNKTLKSFQPETAECRELGHFQNECKGCTLLSGKIYWFEDYSNNPTIERFDLRQKTFSCVGKVKHCVLSGDILTVPHYPSYHPSALV